MPLFIDPKQGTQTNDNAAAGKIGEIVESSIASGSAVALTTATAKTVTSISITAGDWDVWGNVLFLPNAATTVTHIRGGINTTTDTMPTAPAGGAIGMIQATLGTGLVQGIPGLFRRMSVASTTTVYLVALSEFGVNTQSAFGYIGARRVR